MKRNVFLLVLITCFFFGNSYAQEKKQWTLKECIDYALQNNISLKKTNIQKKSSHEDLLQSQAALLPSLSASTSHSVAYTPWPETGRSTVANGYAVSSVDKVYYNGSYGVNGNWTVWNGGRNTNTVKLNKLTEEQAELDSAEIANQLQEQIAQLYVQILYSEEAIKVNEQTAETTRKNEERGKTMVEVGKMSKADLAQLTAQRAQAEFNIVDAKSNLRNFKRQLKQILQITDLQEFDVAIPATTDEMALQLIPSLNEVYTSALASRPEIRNAMLGIESSDLSIKIAKAGKLPQIGLNAGFSTNTTSMNDKAWGTQLKSNVNLGAGVSISIPLYDQRQTKSQVNKALLQKENYMLDLKDKQTTLYSTIENYWLQAVNNQDKFKAAKISTESQQTSFELLSEQFRLGLKNIIELMTGADNLRAAQQNELQSKYLAILNIEMLKFYRDGYIK
ncbi:MAG: TolC family protein [Prevotella sp.]|nr:TolC family protein [Prevotella sp.]